MPYVSPVQELARGKDGTLTPLYEARKPFRGVAAEEKDGDEDGKWRDLGVDEEGEPIDREAFYDEYIRQEEDLKPRPTSPAFYTGRARYFDVLSHLRQSIGQARSTLKTLQLLPLPDFARASLLPLHPFWKPMADMSADIGMELNTARYRRLVVVLNELNECLQIATTSGCTDLADMLDSIVSMFEQGEEKQRRVLAQGKIKRAPLDKYGRSYTLGRRKTSSARVWMIPVSQGSVTAPTASVAEMEEQEAATTDAPPGSLLDAPMPPPISDVVEPTTTTDVVAEPVKRTKPVQKVDIPVTTILVNNIPLHQYFHNNADRERVTYPLKLAGVLGRFNIFTLARGGGLTGQTGAIAHGIAKGLLAHDIGLHRVLKKGLLPLFCLFQFAVADHLSSSRCTQA